MQNISIILNDLILLRIALIKVIRIKTNRVRHNNFKTKGEPPKYDIERIVNVEIPLLQECLDIVKLAIDSSNSVEMKKKIYKRSNLVAEVNNLKAYLFKTEEASSIENIEPILSEEELLKKIEEKEKEVEDITEELNLYKLYTVAIVDPISYRNLKKLQSMLDFNNLSYDLVEKEVEQTIA